MDLPHSELKAPLPHVVSLEAVDQAVQTLAVDGRAAGLAALVELPDLRFLWISRVPADVAALIGRLPRLERLVIHELRAADLTSLAPLGRLRSLAVAGSPKLRSLAGLEQLAELEELILFDNCNFDDLTPIQGLGRLTTLCLEGGFSKMLRLSSLSPLAGLDRLRRLRLASVRIADRSLRPLHGLSGLREVFVAHNFPKPELRALAAALPQAKGEWLDSFRP